MTTAGERLLAAAYEALSIAKGKADPSTYVVHAPPPVVDVPPKARVKHVRAT